VPDYAPVYGKPQAITYTAGAQITGGQLLSFTGQDTVSPTVANPANFAGVAAHDAPPGDAITVLAGSGVVHETTAAGITAAGLVYAGAAATVTQTAGSAYGAVPIGVATRATNASTGLARWKSLVG
jgi:Uncharacterized conserved protein (DUF2190)